jgi:hypothetical protein
MSGQTLVGCPIKDSAAWRPTIGNYDMASIGLGGFVSSRGWVELVNPASKRLSRVRKNRFFFFF